jgi:hypothetical protein
MDILPQAGYGFPACGELSPIYGIDLLTERPLNPTFARFMILPLPVDEKR